MSLFGWSLAVTLAFASLASTTPVLAHGALKQSVPAKGAHLTRAPQEIRLTFTEAPELAVTRIELIGPDGAPVALDAIRALPDSAVVIIARIKGALDAGGYSVRWQIAGKDGHPVRDRFSFTIAPGATGLGGQIAVQPPPAGDSSAGHGAAATPQHHDPVSMPESETAFDAESPLYAVIRWLTFAGILIVVGVLAFHYAVLGLLRKKHPEGTLLAPMSARAATIGWWAAGLLVVVALVRLYAQSYALHGSRQVLSLDLVSGLLGQTLWGRAWLLQISAAIVIAVAFQSVRRGRSTGWIVAAIAGLALTVTPALSGHAVASPRLTGLAVLADTAHVIGAGGWLGSLLVLLMAGIPSALRLPDAERGPAVASLVNAFSPTALVFASVLAVTGVIAAWLHLGTLSALWQSDYGRTLMVKLALLSVVAGTGAYNWLRVKPTLGNAIGTQRVRRSATVEIVVAALVLAVTAVLVATPPPMEMAGASPGVGAAMQRYGAARRGGAASWGGRNARSRVRPPLRRSQLARFGGKASAGDAGSRRRDLGAGPHYRGKPRVRQPLDAPWLSAIADGLAQGELWQGAIVAQDMPRVMAEWDGPFEPMTPFVRSTDSSDTMTEGSSGSTLSGVSCNTRRRRCCSPRLISPTSSRRASPLCGLDDANPVAHGHPRMEARLIPWRLAEERVEEPSPAPSSRSTR